MIVTHEKVSAKERIIVALDFDTAKEAREVIAELRGEVGAFKIGLQLFTAAGPDFIREVVEQGIKLFLDVKFHDIPNTVAKASVEVARLGVWLFNIHALGGSEMMRRTVEEVTEVCLKENLQKPKIIGVTVLTSSNQQTLTETGINFDTTDQVLRLARLSAESGLNGVVASPHETELIRGEIGSDFLIVTPGVRPAFAANDDQKRVMTPADAVKAGSDYLVIGRPVTKADNMVDAVYKIIAEIESLDS